tara:strand:- start:11 stop:253 length:243 start_codon:yes stop_codon:yes gene_type:complete
MSTRHYTTEGVAKTVGVNLRKVISMVERGYVAPSIQDAKGHGSKRLWAFSDIKKIIIVLFLEEVGLKPHAIKSLLNTEKS